MSALEYLHLRPRFAFDYNASSKEVLELLKKHFDQDKECIGKVAHNEVNVDVPKVDQHYWSPQMSFSIEEKENHPNHCHVRGLIGPRPAVWTLFMFFYFLIGLIGAFTSLYGWSLKTLGEESYTLIWAFPLALLLIGTGYFVSKAGEKLGHDQIIILKNYVKKGFGSDFDQLVLTN